MFCLHRWWLLACLYFRLPTHGSDPERRLYGATQAIPHVDASTRRSEPEQKNLAVLELSSRQSEPLRKLLRIMRDLIGNGRTSELISRKLLTAATWLIRQS